MKTEAESRRRRRRTVNRKRASVKKRAADDVNMRTKRNGGEVTQTVNVRVTRHGRKRTPSDGASIEEIRRGDGRILREDTDENVTVMT